jgi:hypothetical protein
VPDAATQTAIKEMYHASVAGEAFDQDRWPMFKAWPHGGSGPSLSPATNCGPKSKPLSAEHIAEGLAMAESLKLRATTQAAPPAAD